MTRAALVASVVAVAATIPLSAAAGGPGRATPRSTFVVRGIVVQYIAPSASVVGSLTVRVVSTGERGRALLGELVTVGVDHGKRLNTAKLSLPRSIWTITLRAVSSQSILKGTAAVQRIAANSPGKGSLGSPAPKNGISHDSGSGGATSATNNPAGSGTKPQSDGGDANGSSGQGRGSDSSGGNGPSDNRSGQPSDDGSGGTANGSGPPSGSGAGSGGGHK